MGTLRHYSNQMQICHYKIKVIDQAVTLEFIAQSIVGAPDFWGTTLRMAMVTDSVSHTESVITD